MADGVNVFSLSLQRKWPQLWTRGRGSVICGTQQIKTNKKKSERVVQPWRPVPRLSATNGRQAACVV